MAIQPGDQPLEHVMFGLKYEGIDLALLQQVFKAIPAGDVADIINAKPSSKYSRQIGFLYEFLTDEALEVNAISGNYVDLIDPADYVLPEGQKEQRWRVNNNLPGNASFCPLVRRTPVINKWLAVNFSTAINNSISDVDPSIFARAVNYLYFKETKSSNDIEREVPSAKKELLFVDLLKNAGRQSGKKSLSEDGLVNYQNIVTERRFNDERYRLNQNYVGEVSYYGRAPTVHLIGMPPQFVDKTMSGFAEFDALTAGMNPVVKATCLSFGFVFVHPFDDGNGRVHRFLFNDVLAREGLLEQGVILPVSAVMFKNMHDYNTALETFSKPLMSAATFSRDQDDHLTVLNPESIAGYYVFPDLTCQTEYMFATVDLTINVELVNELKIIQAMDSLRSDIKYIVDMPNKETELMLKLLHQGNGSLSNTKRKLFNMLTEDEISLMESAYLEVFHSEEDDDGFGPR